MGIQNDGSLWACGKNTSRQFGNETKISSSEPVRVGSDNDWAMISTEGITGSFAIKKDGILWGWGTRTLRELGINEPRISRDTIIKPMQIGTYSDWSDISAGDFHRLAIKKDGTLWIWGKSLGPGEDKRIPTPTQIGAENDWVKIDAGLYMSVAI